MASAANHVFHRIDAAPLPAGRRRLHPILILAATFAAAGVIGTYALAQGRPARQSVLVLPNGREAIAGEVLVKFTRALAQSERLQLEQELDANDSEAVGLGFRRMRSRRLDVASLVAALRTRTDVEYAEPNYVWHTTVSANDPQFSGLWGLRNTAQVIGGQTGIANADIHAASAWGVATGSRANVVAVVDTGIDYTHEDLAANVWSAPNAFTVTIGGVSITCQAGTHGFNAITKTCDPRDDNNHGTHVAGTIGASGNNAHGVVGVNWNASIMGLKFLDSAGSGSSSDAINAIEFAIQAKNAFASTGGATGVAGANVRVLSNSWGGGGFSQALLDEVNKANTNGMLFVAAAGNAGTNNDTTPFYPAGYSASNVLAVAATDNTDRLASFSNFGVSVHLAAPGVNILSTTIGNTYQYFSGTSMATPHVSGSAALLLSKCALDTAALKAAVLNNVDVIPALSGRVSTSGRLNVDRALRACAPSGAPTAPAAPSVVTLR
jgi:subtilisin family serine protease